jgi:hypothetical protein
MTQMTRMSKETLITAILAAMVAIYFAVCILFGSVMFK